MRAILRHWAKQLRGSWVGQVPALTVRGDHASQIPHVIVSLLVNLTPMGYDWPGNRRLRSICDFYIGTFLRSLCQPFDEQGLRQCLHNLEEWSETRYMEDQE
jgi:hypothetical protein